MEFIITSDGSHTLFLPELNETYHSKSGATTESLYVFIKQGLNYLTEKNTQRHFNILEIGFGTGLNAWLTALECENQHLFVTYRSLEKYPLAQMIYSQLNYATNNAELFTKIHHVAWESIAEITANFSLIKNCCDLILDKIPGEEKFDLIYFDAFAPSKQPEIWSEEIFSKLFSRMNPGGILVSYCASGMFKRNLKAAGFIVETLEGPPGKREMVRASIR